MIKLPNKWGQLVFIIFFVLAVTSGTYGMELNGKAALLMDARSGQIFFEKNIDEALPVASVTKMMTLTIILEAVAANQISLDDLVGASPHAASMGGSQIWLEIGEQLTLREMIYAIAVGSANDAAVAVAEYVAGTEQGFVDLMNRRARELGLTNTTFSNASGLPPSRLNGGTQVMSARDVAILARHALTVPLLMEFVSTYEYTMRPQTSKRPQLWNYNKLLVRYPGVDGIKTGFTTEAGYCFATTAQRDGLRLIAVVLGASSDANREKDIRTLLDYGFRKYANYVVIPKNQSVGVVTFKKGSPPEAEVELLTDLAVTVERGEEAKVTTKISYYDNLPLPLAAGEPIGKIEAFLGEQHLATVELTTDVNIQRGGLLTLIFRMARNMITSILQV